MNEMRRNAKKRPAVKKVFAFVAGSFYVLRTFSRV